MSCSATACCKARRRLPRALLEYVSTQVTNELARDAERACRWLGHRMWRADGTSFSMPDTAELQETFGQPGGQRKGCGFPSASLLVLCDAAGFIVKTLAMPLRTHDASQAEQYLERISFIDALRWLWHASPGRRSRSPCSWFQNARAGLSPVSSSDARTPTG